MKMIWSTSIVDVLLIAIAVIASVSGQCTIGQQVEQANDDNRAGQFLILDEPATCSGSLTVWHFCYYRSLTATVEYTFTFRVWRKVQDNDYVQVGGTIVTGNSTVFAGSLVCPDAVLPEEQFIAVEAGDVIGALIPTTDTETVSVLGSGPGSDQVLYQRVIDGGDVTLSTVDNLRLHLQATITSPPTQPPIATTMAPITTLSTTTMSPTTGQTDEPPQTTAFLPMTSGNPVLPSVGTPGSPAAPSNDAGGSAAAAVVVLVIIIGVAVGLIILLLCCMKKKHGSLKGWLQSSRNLAMDNLIYRVSSDRIPIRVHKQPSQATLNIEPQGPTNPDGTPYDIPRDRRERALYAIPTNNTPSAHSSQNYSVVRPFSDVSTLTASEYNVVPPHNERTVEVNVTDCDKETPQNGQSIAMNVPEYNVIPPRINVAAQYNLVPSHKEKNAVPSDGLATLGNGHNVAINVPEYNVIPPRIDVAAHEEKNAAPTEGLAPPGNEHMVPEGYSLVPQRNGQIVAPGYNLVPPRNQKAVDQRKRLSEQIYIYMENEETDGGDGTEKQQQAAMNDDEVYIYLRYGTVEYHKLLSQASEKEERDKESPFKSPPSNEEEIYVVLSEQHIKVMPKKAVETKERLGSGHFGNVHKGTWSGSKGTLQVAVKSLNNDASQADKVRLLQEAAIMGQFKHPNITHLHGIVTQGEPLLLIMEYMPKGDLKRYLTNLRPEPDSLIPGSVPMLLVSFSQQVALGMHYLASKGFVHRDLAARNIFIGEDDNCKIGDFGMSRDLSDDGSYTGRGGKVPIKWTAPEAVHRRKYSTASDVWSYGCLLYEIWSLGRKPFRGIESTKALQLIDSGYRLPPPPGCPFVIYDLMIKCWHPVAGSRPKYRDMLTCLLQDEKKVHDIPVEDASTHPEACLLGAPMEAGKGMYMGLQHCYNPDASDKHDPDYEYGETD